MFSRCNKPAARPGGHADESGGIGPEVRVGLLPIGSVSRDVSVAVLDYAGLQRNPAAADVCEVFCLRGPRGLGKTLFAAFGAASQGCGFAILAPVKTVVVFDSV